MKAVQLVGRLGNQMFIYAFAKALEHYSKDKVYFDTSWFGNSSYNTLELENIFNIKLDIVPEKDLHKLKNNPFQSLGFINKLTKKLNFLFEFNCAKEKVFNKFQKNLLTRKGDCYYSGYFQSEKYFKDIEFQIRKDFTFKPIKDKNLIKLREEIESFECPIFINIRRGDYVTLDQENIAHWLCDMSYYQKASKFMVEKYPNCTFIAVSDEPEWVKNNLKIDYPFKIYSSGTPYLDIYLLQACQHAICANSSYSWWAAWLIDNPNKTVIAPFPWFEKGVENDVIPDDWIKIPRCKNL